MNFLSVGENQTFSGSNRPNQGNIVLFAPTGRSRLSIRQSFFIGKAKTPETDYNMIRLDRQELKTNTMIVWNR